jgi:hypothetical protein
MGGYDYFENCNDDHPMMSSTWCCELCGHELRNLLLLRVMIVGELGKNLSPLKRQNYRIRERIHEYVTRSFVVGEHS